MLVGEAKVQTALLYSMRAVQAHFNNRSQLQVQVLTLSGSSGTKATEIWEALNKIQSLGFSDHQQNPGFLDVPSSSLRVSSFVISYSSVLVLNVILSQIGNSYRFQCDRAASRNLQLLIAFVYICSLMHQHLYKSSSHVCAYLKHICVCFQMIS